MSTKFTVYELLNDNRVTELHSSRIDYGGTTVDDAYEDFLEEIFGKLLKLYSFSISGLKIFPDFTIPIKHNYFIIQLL